MRVSKRIAFVFLAMLALLLALGLPIGVGQALAARPQGDSFVEVAPAGFYDIHNNGVWSMIWWQDKLFVGTVRDFACWSAAALNAEYPTLFPYPPRDATIPCTPDPYDLPARAEIWRYTPETLTWERVYQAPQTVPVPGQAGETFARDVGYRDMAIFTEPDGTEALYVGSVFPRPMFYENDVVPPPRLLRSTDGLTFEEVPHDPGTVLGDVEKGSITRLTNFQDRLYAIMGVLRGDGPLYEATDPASGNDSFRQITPEGMQVFETASFNGYLYVGTVVDQPGLPRAGEAAQDGMGASVPVTDTQQYTVWKTDATGTPPYTFIPLLPEDGYLPRVTNQNVISLFVYKGRLYAGTESPTELYRFNPDDSWDLIVGTPRDTPDGYKEPLSGYDVGFDWIYNIHAWRMQEHEGVLYLGTADSSSTFHDDSVFVEQYGEQIGFDLFASEDGETFTPITVNGFGDLFQYGARSLESTPEGLVVGSMNNWGAMRIWRGRIDVTRELFLPVARPGTSAARAERPAAVPIAGPATAPRRLMGEETGEGALLSWEGARGALRYRVYRSTLISQGTLADPAALRPAPWVEVGSTDDLYYLDRTAVAGQRYQYLVRAEHAAAQLSGTSNVVPVPSLAPRATFAQLRGSLEAWAGASPQAQARVEELLLPSVTQAVASAQAGDWAGTRRHLAMLAARAPSSGLPTWRIQDLDTLLDKVARRLHLAEAGLLSGAALE